MACSTGAHATVVADMIDIRLVREDAGAVKAALARRGVDGAEVDRLASLDLAAPGGNRASRRTAGPR